MQYSEKVMDHFMNPRNSGVIENPDGYGKVGSPSCGDVMEIFLKIEGDIIKDVKFRTFGCASAIATSSISTEMILEKNIFVELVLPASVIRKMTETEMDVYRRPFLNPGEDRRPTLTWPTLLSDAMLNISSSPSSSTFKFLTAG